MTICGMTIDARARGVMTLALIDVERRFGRNLTAGELSYLILSAILKLAAQENERVLH